jgi:hypothetical protein
VNRSESKRPQVNKAGDFLRRGRSHQTVEWRWMWLGFEKEEAPTER